MNRLSGIRERIDRQPASQDDSDIQRNEQDEELERRPCLKSKEISEEGREFMRCSTEGFLYAYDGLFSLRNTHHPRQYIYTKWVEERQSKC